MTLWTALGRVRHRVKDERVLALANAFLKAGVMTGTGIRRNPTNERVTAAARTAG
jgi:hypothetical protein